MTLFILYSLNYNIEFFINKTIKLIYTSYYFISIKKMSSDINEYINQMLELSDENELLKQIVLKLIISKSIKDVHIKLQYLCIFILLFIIFILVFIIKK